MGWKRERSVRWPWMGFWKVGRTSSEPWAAAEGGLRSWNSDWVTLELGTEPSKRALNGGV